MNSTCESSAPSPGARKPPTSARIRSLDNFDFAFNACIDRARIYELAACHFIREQRDALLVGPPGVGKSHLAQAIGIEAIKAGFLVLYRSVFDLVRELSLEATQAGESRLLGKISQARSPHH